MKRYWENLRPFEKRVVVGVASLMFVIFNFWFVFPHFSDWDRMKFRMETAQRKLAKFENEIRQTDFYQVEVKKLQGEGLDVPAQEQVQQFQSKVNEEEIKAGVTPRNQSRPLTSTNEFFLEQSQNIVVESGEQQLVDFLYNLGAAHSLIRVRDMTLNPDPAHFQLTASLKLIASYQKNPSQKSTPTPARGVASRNPSTPSLTPGLPAGNTTAKRP